ncbi:MAG: metallophosphoesterase family protein [Actinomycetaceae bacterium]|nr:metallophosphoesterase family protein [Actinomycetaceae bacterium]
MTVFFTSDHHFGHARIIELAHRPFDSVDHMHSVLIQRWFEMVTPKDTVYHLGDLALGSIEKSMEIAASLPGKKYLIPGNHDRVSSTESRSRQERYRHLYTDAGFEILPEQIEVDLAELAGADGNCPVRLCHYPPFGDSHSDKDRFVHLRPPMDIPVIHGHTHQADPGNGFFVHIGVDGRDYRPVSAAAILEEIRAAQEKSQQ